MSRRLDAVFRSFSVRIFGIFGALVLSINLLMLLGGAWTQYRDQSEEVSRLALTVTETLAFSVRRVSVAGKYHTRLLVEDLAREQQAIHYIAVQETSGLIFAHSDPAQNGLYDTSEQATAALTVAQGKEHLVQDYYLDGAHLREVDVPFVSGYGDQVLGVVRVGIALDELDRKLADHLRIYFLLGTLLAAFSVALIVAASHYFGAPMQRMAQTLQGILAHAPLAILVQDSHKGLRHVNPRFRDLYREVDAGPEALMRELEGLPLADAAAERVEVSLRVSGHERSFIATRFPVEYAADGSLLSIGTMLLDVTAARDVEEQLRQSQKIEAMGQLAGGIAHDFNNLLTGIIGFADMAIAEEPSEAVQEHLQTIRRTGERASELTRQILAFSRKQIIDRRPLDLSQVVLGMQRLLVRVISESFSVQTRLSKGVVVLADQSQVEQVLLNLVTNAQDAMRGSGNIVLYTGVEPLPHLQDGPRFGVLRVTDTGEGIPSAVLPHIFEPFFTTKVVGKGTGLGLSTVYGIVKQHAGEILVDSSPEVTSFSVYLPLANAGPAEAREASEDQAEPVARPPRGELVLLVEDEPLVRRLLLRILQGAGYRVVVAEHGLDAVEVFKARHEEIDVVLMDVMMPQLNGKEAWARMRGISASAKVIFMSGYTADIIHEHGDRDTTFAFLSKPVTRDALLSKLQQVLRG
ncbi:MAG: response regulator [Deltaproteobacteria bacterium]|nr:response regulator [Deltaproteobacteria bacterium]